MASLPELPTTQGGIVIAKTQEQQKPVKAEKQQSKAKKLTAKPIEVETPDFIEDIKTQDETALDLVNSLKAREYIHRAKTKEVIVNERSTTYKECFSTIRGMESTFQAYLRQDAEDLGVDFDQVLHSEGLY